MGSAQLLLSELKQTDDLQRRVFLELTNKNAALSPAYEKALLGKLIDAQAVSHLSESVEIAEDANVDDDKVERCFKPMQKTMSGRRLFLYECEHWGLGFGGQLARASKGEGRQRGWKRTASNAFEDAETQTTGEESGEEKESREVRRRC